MRKTMNWNDSYDSVAQEVGFQHSEIAETVAGILERIPADRRPVGMRVFIDCHELKIEHSEVDGEVKSIINEAIEAANPMIPQQYAVFRQVGAVRGGKMRMEVELPFTLEKFEFDTHLEGDAEDFLEDALTALKFERTEGKKNHDGYRAWRSEIGRRYQHASATA